MGLLRGQLEDAVGDTDLTASPISGAVRFSSSQQLAGESLKLWVLHAADVDAGNSSHRTWIPTRPDVPPR